MILAVDVGNTETVIGLCRGTEPTAVWRMATDPRRTPDEHRHLLEGFLESGAPGRNEEPALGTVASVVPMMDHLWSEVTEAMGMECLVVDASSELPVRLDVKEPDTVGPDRIANTLAAHHLFGRDTVVVDLGTATTFDCISSDGAFRGGVIAPGPRAGMERLAQAASRLPQAEIRPPSGVVGRTTRDCLAAGVFYSIVDSIDGIVERIIREWDPEDALVVATGGMVDRIAPHCRSVHRVEPHLTLVGLAVASEHLRATG